MQWNGGYWATLLEQDEMADCLGFHLMQAKASDTEQAKWTRQ